ncbi:MAG: hypothetical protein JSV35_03290 [Candidatus Bathyarchaeota archaeon]|nr:MAG: hypothetical protein JSV35_03290 [Candidatus Bathyarchaeota archaeon]
MKFRATSILGVIITVTVPSLFPLVGMALNEMARVDVRWILGPDAPQGAYISGNTVILDFDVEQGTPVNFTEALFLKNEDPTRAYDLEISLDRAVPASEFVECKIHIYEYSTTPSRFVDTLDLADGADVYNGALTAGGCLRISLEVNTVADAGETYSFRVKLEVS